MCKHDVGSILAILLSFLFMICMLSAAFATITFSIYPLEAKVSV